MNSKYVTKNYLHLDTRKNYRSVKKIIEDPNRVASHGFFPFIHYEIIFKIYKNGIKDEKKRNINYTAHIDGFIYRFYSDLLNEKYNKYLSDRPIDEVVTAYRTNKKGKNNIYFAAEVIKFISELDNCYIFVGDYEGFFDNLNHDNLKERLKEVLGTNRLDLDWYKVFLSVTKYSYVNKDDINKKLGSDIRIKKQISRNKLKYKYFQNTSDLKEFKKEHLLRNEKSYGIPQGTAMSGILANIYMIHLDEKFYDMVSKYDGLYRRYSDDFIVVIPKNKMKDNEFSQLCERIYTEIKADKLKIQKSKSKCLLKDNQVIKDIKTGEDTTLDYLGFVFDGYNLNVRQKSVYKYYRSAYRYIDKAKQKSIGSDRLKYKRKIYSKYTIKGKFTSIKYDYNKKISGNFITYAYRSINVFSEIDKIECKIHDQIKNHEKHVQRRIHLKMDVK
nr:reverse transcriptase domain-containing protein [Mammaliicoccus sp. Marseille-Q6498]